MKKRIFGTLLMGAMLVSSMSTFVSCKDYDDDINSLQTQLNSLSSLLDTKEATINSTLNSIQATLNTLTSMEATLKGQIADGDAATLAAARQAVADAQAALQAAINGNYSDLVAANAAQDAAILAAKTAADQALAQLAQLSTVESVMETVSKDVASATADLTQAKLDLSDLTNKYNTLNEDLTQAISEIAELKTAVAGQQAALEAIGGQTGLAQVQQDVASLLAQLTALDQTVKDLTAAQTEFVTNQLASINTTLAALQAAQANFADKESLTAVQNKVNTMQTDVNGLSDKIDTAINTLIPALAKALRSLVYIPYLYVDGIETIEYPYLHDTALVLAPAQILTRQRTHAGFVEDYEKTIRDAASTRYPKLAPLRDWVTTTHKDSVFFYGPAWPVEYHMNPSLSTTAWSDVKGWSVRKAEVITRSDAASSIKVAETYVDGTPLFKNEKGILTVGLRIDNVAKMATQDRPKESDGRPDTGNWTHLDGTTSTTDCQYDDIIALQVNSGKDTIITSDYAMVYPEKCYLEGIYWTKYQGKQGYTGVSYDEECNYTTEINHVWDSPAKALAAAGDDDVYPDIELYYNDSEGICLKDYLGVHLVRESKTVAGKTNPYCLPFNKPEIGQWGLSYEFQLVGYSIDGNSTIDSNYAEFTDADDKGISKTGTIRAKNVKEDGTTIDEVSATSIDREPLVRVLVKHGNHVVLDGYILIHITKKQVSAEDPGNLIVDNYPKGDEVKFDLCNGATVLNTNWSQFSYFVLTQKLENMTKEEFDAQYGKDYNGVPDLSGTSAPVTLSDNSTRYDDVTVFDDANGTVCTTLPGQVQYYHNSVGTTNHRFEWKVSAEELEAYTHDLDELPKEFTKYFRYTGKTGAKYQYIYVQMTMVLNRATVAESGIKEKNANYWYAESGDDDGWDAVVWNPYYPQNGKNTRLYEQELASTFVGNNVQFTGTGLAACPDPHSMAKFYFTPDAFEIKAQSGQVYVITPKHPTYAPNYNQFFCKYHGEKHAWGTAEQNKILHEKCAIDYTKGVYENTNLYAVKKAAYDANSTVASEYRLIAELTPDIAHGTMKLTWNTLVGDADDEYTREVLNAIGYEEAHANILKELHTKVGVIAQNGCDVAANITDGTFYVSWQRPINVDTQANPMVDAKNNGDYIYTVDFLKLYDWRGPVEGKMYGANQWLWAYYGVRGIKIDTRPDNVYTNMHQTDKNNFVKLSSITTMAQLGVLDEFGVVHIGANHEIDFNISGYNSATMNAGLLAHMGINPEDNDKKREFAGGLFYANNGDNVEEFDLKIPVTVVYDWGEFISEVVVHIDRTLGN